MRILVHDFAGYSFPVQLSRQLAARGHYVTHIHSVGLDGPKGRLRASETDSERLQIRGIPLSKSFRKYSAFRRFATQRKYAHHMRAIISRERPDVVLSADTPIDIQAELLWHCRRNNIGFVHWVQDIYCSAIDFFLKKTLGGLSRSLSFPFKRLEIAVANQSNSTVVISPEFRDLYVNWGVPTSKIDVIENWAPLEELPAHVRQNAWSSAQGLNNHKVFLYSGTLGLKHLPNLLYVLAKTLGATCKVVVVSEGVGREYLEKMPTLENLVLLDFQPYDRLSEVLATADVLLATLESDASRFAVPSKILSYLCAGRPLLMAAPRSNLAAAVIERSGAGLVVDPEKSTEWVEAARHLASDWNLRSILGSKARRYSEQAFDIRNIAIAFENILVRSQKLRQPLYSRDFVQEASSGIETNEKATS